jgi:hypothetical protein
MTIAASNAPNAPPALLTIPTPKPAPWAGSQTSFDAIAHSSFVCKSAKLKLTGILPKKSSYILPKLP